MAISFQRSIAYSRSSFQHIQSLLKWHPAMFNGKKIGAILLLGGTGSRFGGSIPKQFSLLGNLPLFTYALKAIQASNLFDEIVLVSHPSWEDRLPASFTIATGGKTRQLSSYHGIRAFKEKPDIVLIHDGVRPFVSAEILKNNLSMAIAYGAADTCIPSADTLVYAPNQQIISNIPDRTKYLRGQTPQTFRYEWILEAHELALKEGLENATDDCQLILRMGKEIHVVPGDEKNIKITTEFDLRLAELLLKKSLD